MRISDWSSDVCSSDLRLRAQVGAAADADLGRRAVDVHVVAARLPVGERDRAANAVEGEALGEKAEEVQQQPERQLGDAEQAQHAGGGRLEVDRKSDV